MPNLRIAVRRLARERGFAATVVFLMALGIAATTAVFMLLQRVLFSPLDYPESGRLAWIEGTQSGWMLGEDFFEIRERLRSFQNTAAYIEGGWIVTDDGREAERLSGARVTRDFFDVLRVRPVMGREFSPDEYRTGREMEVVFSFPFWQRRYGGDPGVIGRRVTLDGIPYQVTGVMPAGFPLESVHDMRAPLPDDSPYMTGRRWRIVRVFGRLSAAADVRGAQAEVNRAAADLAARYSDDRGLGLRVITFLEREVGGSRPSLWMFAAAVGCVLLVACSNVASLLLARGAARVREMAVRCAVGASRVNLITLLLAENVILALAGGLIGFPLAMAGIWTLMRVDPKALPRMGEVHADIGGLAFALGASVVASAIFGVAPALSGSKVNLTEALQESSRGSSGRRGNRLRAALVVLEVALGVVLLSSAGLVGRSLIALDHVDPGYRVRNVWTAQISPTSVTYNDGNALRRFYERSEEALDRIPGVEAAGPPTGFRSRKE